MNKEFVKYEGIMRLHLRDKDGNVTDLDIKFPIEVNEFKSKIEALGFNIDDVGSNCYYFNMLDEEGWNYNIIPTSKTLTDYNLIGLVFDDINNLEHNARVEYEKDAAKYKSFLCGASNQYLRFEDIKYYYKVINKKTFPNQELRKRLKWKYFEKFYLAGVIRRSIESGKDYFSEDVCWLS